MTSKFFSRYRVLFIFLGISLAVFGLARLYYNLTDDFRIANITHIFPYREEWATPPLAPNEQQLLDAILSQKFHYLAKGAQSYVFLSEDGEHVIKFFKFKHLRPSWFFTNAAALGLFQDYHTKLAARKERKLWGVFGAHKLAYDFDRDESGLFYIQLNVEGNPVRYVTVRDKIGIERTINLEKITFIVQKRGEPLREVLRMHLDKGDIQGAEDRLSKIFDMYAAEYSRGFYDHDHGVMRNIGFAGELPIHLDVGKLSPAEEMKEKTIARADALLVANNIKIWLQKSYPQASTTLSAFIDAKIASLYE